MPCLLLLFSILAFQTAHAGKVILLVNMNYSAEELKALEEVAAERGQRVEVVPPREMTRLATPMFRERDTLEANVKKLHPEWDAVDVKAAVSEIMRVGSDYPDQPLVENLAEKMDRLRDLAQAVADAEEKNGSVYDQLNAKAEELRQNGDQVDSIAFSSHSDGANLTGETAARLSSADLYQLRNEHPEIFSKPRHVLLLGCYNLTETNRERWRYDFFPGAVMLGGFGVRAPSRKDPLSSNFIREMMRTASAIDKKSAAGNRFSPSLLNETFLGLKSFTNSIYPGVVDLCGQVFEGRPGASRVACQEQWENFFDQAKKIESVYIGLKTLSKDPPPDGAGSDLRGFYNTLQNVCPARKDQSIDEETQANHERYRTTLRENTIRLIFWWNVQQNFRAYYARDLAQLDRDLREAGISNPIPELDGKAGRVEFVRAFQDLREEIRKKTRELGYSRNSRTRYGDDPRENLKELARRIDIYKPLFYLNGEDSAGDGEQTSVEHTLELGGIPFNWIEGATVLRSR